MMNVSVHITYLISSHLTLLHLNWVYCKATQFAVAATNQNEIGHIQSCLIGRSHGELGRFHSAFNRIRCIGLMKSDEMRWTRHSDSSDAQRVTTTLRCTDWARRREWAASGRCSKSEDGRWRCPASSRRCRRHSAAPRSRTWTEPRRRRPARPGLAPAHLSTAVARSPRRDSEAETSDTPATWRCSWVVPRLRRPRRRPPAAGLSTPHVTYFRTSYTSGSQQLHLHCGSTNHRT